MAIVEIKIFLGALILLVSGSVGAAVIYGLNDSGFPITYNVNTGVIGGTTDVRFSSGGGLAYVAPSI